MAHAGHFVVVWSQTGSSNSGIFNRLYHADGTPQGPEFQVGNNEGHYVDVAMDPEGNFVVVWSCAWHLSPGIYAQTFDASGVASSAEFRVNTDTSARSYEYPAVSMSPDGRFAVVWHSMDQQRDRPGIYGQRFDAQGNPLGLAQWSNSCQPP